MNVLKVFQFQKKEEKQDINYYLKKNNRIKTENCKENKNTKHKRSY